MLHCEMQMPPESVFYCESLAELEYRMLSRLPYMAFCVPARIDSNSVCIERVLYYSKTVEQIVL